MKPRLRPHTYRADPDMPPDHRGEGRCATCAMPKGHAAHTEPVADDLSARIVGEGGADG